MKKQFKLGVIGGGFMAQAILKGAVYSEFIKPKKIIVSDPSRQALDSLKYLGVNTSVNNRDVAENSEFVLFAVKPQNFAAAAESIHGLLLDNVISIMAGVTRRKIKESLLGKNCRVARAMPNLPCSIGSGMTAIDLTDYADDVDASAFINSVFGNLGNVLLVPEEKLNAVTGISGSGPAYVYMFIEGLIKAGIKQGLTEDEAKTLAVNTVFGGADMVAHSEDKPISDLIAAVCSKGGTTIQAVDSFKADDMYGMIDRAVAACVRRAEELSE